MVMHDHAHVYKYVRPHVSILVVSCNHDYDLFPILMRLTDGRAGQHEW